MDYIQKNQLFILAHLAIIWVWSVTVVIRAMIQAKRQLKNHPKMDKINIDMNRFIYRNSIFVFLLQSALIAFSICLTYS